MDNHTSFFSQGYVRVLVVVILLGVIGALLAYTKLTLSEARYINTGPTTIQVSGEGEVLAKPDIGQFTFSVLAEGEDATEAQTASAEAINEIMEYLDAEGVEEGDIKTTNYYLNPKYRYEERVCLSNSYCPPGERIQDGFEVNQMVEVKVRDLDMAGTLLSGVGERGATNISSLQFTIDDESALMAEARVQAIENAKEKATQLAEDLDVRLVRILNFYENTDERMYGYGGDMMVSNDAMAREAVAPNMPTGENTITSRVNITYEVK